MTLNGQPTYYVAGAFNNEDITAQGDAEGKLHINTVPRAIELDDAKNGILSTVANFEGHLVFPEKPLHIGESFTRETQMAVPFIDEGKAVLKTTYKLVTVNNNLAVFETKLILNFNAEADKGGSKLTRTATGTGKVIFNLTENYPESITSNVDLDYVGIKVNTYIKSLMRTTGWKITTNIKNQIQAN
ncbi:MAG: hypothetical protein JWR50_3247 [Mucilaginibacter sp.]|nr:hypothetical protein [Mucilaginibacter sp.]